MIFSDYLTFPLAQTFTNIHFNDPVAILLAPSSIDFVTLGLNTCQYRLLAVSCNT